MSIGGTRGSGGRGGPRGPRGAGGKGGASGAGKSSGVTKTGGSSFTMVDKPSVALGTSGVGAAGAPAAVEPLLAKAAEIGALFRSGQLKTKEEATKRFVEEILKEKLRMKSSALGSKIAESLLDDPRLNQALERIFAKG